MYFYVFMCFKFKKRLRFWKIIRNELGIKCCVYLKEILNFKILILKIKNNCIIKLFVEEKKRNNGDKCIKIENEFDKVVLYRWGILLIYIVYYFLCIVLFIEIFIEYLYKNNYLMIFCRLFIINKGWRR